MAKKKEKPLTREDVLELIEKSDIKAEGLDFSGMIFEDRIDLSGLDLSGIIFRDAYFFGANLKGAILFLADLRGADLLGVDLREANLIRANLEGAVLYNALLEGANLHGAELLTAELNFVDWGNYIIGEEKRGKLGSAEHKYRQLKTWYANAGQYEVAGKFFYREMEARRKALKWWPNPFNRFFSELLGILCGYGERPLRVVLSAAIVIFGLALAYNLWGSFSSSSFLDTLYYSATSFTALGYGNWAPQPIGWAKGLGAAEAVIGVFMMALFLITFTRKMTR